MAVVQENKRESDLYHQSEKQGNMTPPATPPSKEAPPSYTANGPLDEVSRGELNTAFSSLNLSDTPTSFPTPEHCLAHLKLLNVIHATKEDIGYTDGLFGLWDSRCETLEGRQRDKLLSQIREKRWALYAARAVERFEDWWLKVLHPREGGRRIEGKEMISTNKQFTEFPISGIPQVWTKDMLPPVGKTFEGLCLGSC